MSFSGLYAEQDPVFGSLDGTKEGLMTIPGIPIRRRLHDLGAFVTVCGGAYFFMPSIRALQYLATFKDVPERQAESPSQKTNRGRKDRILKGKSNMISATRILSVFVALILAALLIRWWMHTKVAPQPPTASHSFCIVADIEPPFPGF